MLTYNFANIGSDSLYEYLYKCIKNDILLGNIRPGEKLPSKRTFAKNLGISVITVENAYAQLVAEGYLYSMPKRGFFAADLEIEDSMRDAVVIQDSTHRPRPDCKRKNLAVRLVTGKIRKIGSLPVCHLQDLFWHRIPHGILNFQISCIKLRGFMRV